LQPVREGLTYPTDGSGESMPVRYAAMRVVWIAWLALAGIVLSGPALADKRVALVIGNGAYRNVPALTNPTNDASDVGRALTRLGFSVQTVTNATYDDMRRGLLEFGRKVRGAEIAIVFFAGHGIEVGGENWLIPVDAELRSDVDVDHEAMGLRSVMPAIENASKLGLVILDACRNNPFVRRMQRSVRTRAVARGLASVEPTGNVLVAYAARDGTVAADGEGRNSPFTSSLLAHLETPGLEINFLFRNVRDDVIKSTKREQQPFVYGSLSREAIYLKTAPQPAAVPPPPPSPPADEITWMFLKDTNDPAAFKRFVEQFPHSQRRGEAEKRAADLLLEQGATAKAFEQRMAALAALAAEAREARSRPAGPPPEDIAWNLVKDSNDPNQFRLFLEQFPNTSRRPDAERRIAAIAAEQRAAAAAMEQRLAALTKEPASRTAEPAAPAAPQLDKGEIARLVQLELKRVGCFDGAVNGEFGTSTRTALRNFAKLASVSMPDSELSLDTLKVIRGINKRICPLQCKAGQILKDDTCVAKPESEPKKRVTDKPAPAPRERPAAAAPAAPAASSAPAAGGAGGKCFTFNGRRFCE
jgi:hypothetical protein